MPDVPALARMMTFEGPSPSPIPDACMLTIALYDDGRVAFGCGTDSPHELIARMEGLLSEFRRHPELLAQACGIRNAARHLFGLAFDADSEN
jgi:hypothetical protein